MEPDFAGEARPSDLFQDTITVLGKLRKRQLRKRESFFSCICLFSSRRFRFRLIASTTFLLILSFALPSRGQILITRHDIQHDVSPPLRDLARNAQAAPEEIPHEAEPLRPIPLPPGL